MEKQTQSGFAVVGVAVIAVVLLAGAAYTFRNAGTDNDPVAFVANSVGVKTTGTGSGSATKPPVTIPVTPLVVPPKLPGCPDLGCQEVANRLATQTRAKENKARECDRLHALAYPVLGGQKPASQQNLNNYRKCEDQLLSLKSAEQSLAGELQRCIESQAELNKYCQSLGISK